ncbi:MAG: hypothetical protein K2N05_02070 [Muribaculaceae bacterium]|nr:hypothetical protein [Muribaculaceae bacterium]
MQHIKATAATFVAAVAVVLGMVSCKGRTMRDVEPTGETIEVVVGEESIAPGVIETDTIGTAVTIP